MMTIADILASINEFAPFDTAMDFDNVGLLIGNPSTKVSKVLIALDCTCSVISEAKSIGAELIITHHPIFIDSVKRIDPMEPGTAPAYSLISSGIAHIAAHTNLDIAAGGVNDALANKLGLRNIRPFGDDSLGRIGETDAISLLEYSEHVSKKLQTVIRFSGNGSKTVKNVAVVGGSGSEYFESAKAFGADVLITGECKHHHAIYAQVLDIAIIEAGHYETESVVLEPLKEKLKRCFKRVEFYVSKSETSPLRGI